MTKREPQQPRWADPDEIVGEFWRRCGRPTQRQLDLLVKTMHIPAMALATSADGVDFPVAMFRVVRSRATFEFSDDPETSPVLGFVAWDVDGFAHDLVAWSPRDGWVGTWLGRAAVLGEHELNDIRLGDPVRVYLHLSDWLREHRQGVAIIDKVQAAHLLEGMLLQAVDVEDGLALRKMVERPRARIVVPAVQQQDRVAA